MRNKNITKHQKNEIILNAIYYIVSNKPINIYIDKPYAMTIVMHKLYPSLRTTSQLSAYYYTVVNNIVETYNLNVNYMHPVHIRDYAKQNNIQLFEFAYFDVNFSSANKP